VGVRFPTVVAAWRRAWTQVIPFFAFPPEVRRVIYTTNALESVHSQLRQIMKTRGHFPNDEAATKLLWLALRNITATWDATRLRTSDRTQTTAQESVRTTIAPGARVDHPPSCG
jgi:putative transposase